MSPPKATVRRLSFYLRLLHTLYDEGVALVSSQELAALLELNPAQVRKDLAHFGEFGKRGVGYSVPRLRDHLVDILGLQAHKNVAIIGAGGYLGHALANYTGFAKRNFRVVALFDKDPHVLSQKVGGIGPIRHISTLPEVVKSLDIEIVILTVPAQAVREVSDFILLSGVKAVLNFAPVNLPNDGNIVVQNVDLAIELETLSFRLTPQNNRLKEDSPAPLLP